MPRGLGPKVSVFLPDASVTTADTAAHDPTRLLAPCAAASPAGTASERSRSEAEIAASVFRRFMIFPLDCGWGRGTLCLAFPRPCYSLRQAGKGLCCR